MRGDPTMTLTSTSTSSPFQIRMLIYITIIKLLTTKSARNALVFLLMKRAVVSPGN